VRTYATRPLYDPKISAAFRAADGPGHQASASRSAATGDGDKSQVIIGGAAVVVMTVATAFAGVDNDIAKFLRVDTRKQLTAALSFAIWASVIYTVLSALMTAATASISARLWNPAYPGVRAIFAVTVAWVSVVSLVPLLFLLYRTVPGLTKPLPDGQPEPEPAANNND
jgi:hypothetical protein